MSIETKAKSIMIGGSKDKHYIGDIYCEKCYGNYPQRCVCSGLIHREGDGGGGYSFDYQCDQCDDHEVIAC